MTVHLSRRNSLLILLLLFFILTSLFLHTFLPPSVSLLLSASRSFTIASISMPSPQEGWAVGEAAGQPRYLLLHYQHGAGRREFPKAMRQLPERDIVLRSISMISPDEGWAIGESFWPLSSPVPSKNGGTEQQCPNGPLLLHYVHRVWTVNEHGATDPTFRTIAMRSPTNGWALGSNGAANTLLQYDGTRWQARSLPDPISTTPLLTLVPVSDKEVWLAGNGLTHDDGASWTRLSLPAPQRPSSLIVFHGLSMISPHEGWAVGEESNSSHGIIVHIVAGHTIIQSQPSTPILSSVAMDGAQSGWAVGARGILLEYRAGQWQSLPRLTEQALHQVVLASHSSEAWAVGDGGTIFQYQHGQWLLSPITVS